MDRWPNIISDLLATGLTRPELAALVGAGASTVNDIARGTTREPRHALGERLLQLHTERVKKHRG